MVKATSASGTKVAVEMRDLNLVYMSKNRQVPALKDVNLSVEEGSFVCLLGPSGCGKTSLLRLIAGFRKPTSGLITLDGEPITGPDRQRGVVFQQPTLYPWLTVQKNVEFGLKMRKLPREERREIARRCIDTVGLQEFTQTYPYELSGGMKQRVAIARVLANDPRLVLMDEPFGALDAMTKEQMQQWVRGIWKTMHKTVVFVTHDIDEALMLGTKVVVMTNRPGRVSKVLNPSFTIQADANNADEVKGLPEFAEMRREIHLSM
ncbi:MAG TPA: ABC transporter ATP-binding protein [Rubrobacteraceae bacterium]|nr:ABC transporter ATP-binding protein [Rubrobacteraceae bacterium]